MTNKKDSLGDRMKEYYENRTRILLPRRTNCIIRIDGKAFHSYTKGLNHPIDEGLTEDMNLTTKYLCENIPGAKFGYVQSDEISIWITDYDNLQTDGWFDNSVQKMCSISASLATAKFNQLRILRLATSKRSTIKAIDNVEIERIKLATFDSRVFSITEKDEVVNYFIWRQQDATRNSISMAAQSMFSHKQLHGKSTSDMQDMMMLEKNVNWNDYPIGFKRGRAVVKIEEVSDLSFKIEVAKQKKNEFIKNRNYEEGAKMRDLEQSFTEQLEKDPQLQVTRKKWAIVEPPIFTQDRDFVLSTLIRNKDKK